MDWKSFINFIISGKLDGKRYSDYALSIKTNVDRASFYKIRRGETKRPQQNTIELLEKAFNIKINDSDPNDITYTKNLEVLTNTNTGNETIGIRDATTTVVVDDIKKGSDMAFFLYRVKQEDDTDIFAKDEIVVISTLEKINKHDKVIIKLKSGKILIKKCLIDTNGIFTLPNNENNITSNIDRIDFSMVECFHKVIK